MAIVVLDPGHGGSKPLGGSSPNNAAGPTGLLEKEATLFVARLTFELLIRQGIDARLTRSTDQNLSLQDRAHAARRAKADAFVSIHFNGYDGTAQGTETYWHRRGTEDSQKLAQCVQEAVRDATGLRNRGVKTAGFSVLDPDAHAPGTAACLVEISFLDVPHEEARLRTAAYQEELARGLASGIARWLTVSGRVAPDDIRPEAWADAEDGYELARLDTAAAPRPDGRAAHPPAPHGRQDAGSDTAIPFLLEPSEAARSGDVPTVHDAQRMQEGWRRERMQIDADGLQPERIIGRDDTLDAVFTEIMARRRHGVCIVRTHGRAYDGSVGHWTGTGFLVGPNLLLTNHHVLNSPEVARAAEVAFDYERSLEAVLNGRATLPSSSRTYRLDPDRLFVTSPLRGGLDFTFVWVDVARMPDGAVIRMERAAFIVQPQDRAFLIHHPGGRPKRVSLDRCDIVSAAPAGPVIHYTSDSETGSSGSPVFDRTGRLIALHHASRQNHDGAATLDGTQPDHVNEGIKIAAIALELETRRTLPGEPTAMIDTVLGEIYGSDTVAGYFGAAGRTARADPTGAERVADLYNGTDQDLDICFWNVERFARRNGGLSAALNEAARIIADMGLDIWALFNLPTDAAHMLLEKLEERFGQRFLCAHGASAGAQTTVLLWNPETVDGGAVPWPSGVDHLFNPATSIAGLAFDQRPALYRFKARGGAMIACNLVPLHLDVQADRHSQVPRLLYYAISSLIDRGEAAGDWIIGGAFQAESAGSDFHELTKGKVAALSAMDGTDGAITYIKAPHSPVGRIFLSPNMSRLYGMQESLALAKEKSQVEYLRRFADHRPVIVRLSSGHAEAAPIDAPATDKFFSLLRGLEPKASDPGPGH